ncbi:MAG TPA: tetraacyldisaccharide 4'-kinase [Chlamydiales bacterium]|nr:tetraacyldisaccharide 4'-kinase [Chlamydiales bacterium]
MTAFLLSIGQKLIERGAWFFAPFSWVWAVVVFIKNKAYDAEWIQPIRVHCIVVSIGNIVAGGTGKTPFVKMLASRFSERKVAILSCGFGPMPDEAMLLQRRLPNARIYIGKSRVLLAEQAVREGAELILLDDGFQHRKLHRDVDVVLLRKDDPFGKGHFLPWGFLRDSPKRLKNADALFIQGRDFRHCPVRILNERQECIPSIQKWKTAFFCGIANPDSFKKILCDLGADIVAELRLADHEMAHPKRLEKFALRAKNLGAKCLMTTEKDFIKGPKCSLPILFVEIEIEWVKGGERLEKLIAKIDQKIDNRPLS